MYLPSQSKSNGISIAPPKPLKILNKVCAEVPVTVTVSPVAILFKVILLTVILQLGLYSPNSLKHNLSPLLGFISLHVLNEKGSEPSHYTF